MSEQTITLVKIVILALFGSLGAFQGLKKGWSLLNKKKDTSEDSAVGEAK